MARSPKRPVTKGSVDLGAGACGALKKRAKAKKVRRADAGQAAGILELHRGGETRRDEAEPDRKDPADDRGGVGLHDKYRNC